MIIDRVENSHLYESLDGKISKAFEFLRKTDFSKMVPGEYEIEGKEVFAIVADYSTKDRNVCELEAHRKYIDVQFMAAGAELVGYAPLSGQKTSVEYDEDRDLMFFAGEASFTKFETGMFAIFFPTDLHMPGIGDGKNEVRKVVVKVRV